MLSSVKFQEYSLSTSPIPLILQKDRKITINTLNQYSFCIAENDSAFKSALVESDILLADGVGIVKACSYLTGQSVKKIAGADMHEYLLNYLSKSGGKCFYLGSSNATLDKIKKRLNREFPNIKAEFYSPPFKSNFEINDLNEMTKRVNEFQPDVVFLGLTAPKQEKLSVLLKDKLDTKAICSIGAVFDFYAETIKRPSQFWIDLNLEWFIRLVKEPRRMWKRYINFGFVFVYLILSSKLMTSRIIRTRFGFKKRPQLA
jgi:N-acetylglucosaminyldiphosphoundecaprenol N-acetyl-beta-D-mannosaminyltransferase